MLVVLHPRCKTLFIHALEGGGKENGAWVWTDGFCTETITLRDLSNAGVYMVFQLGVSILCRGKSRILTLLTLSIAHVSVNSSSCRFYC